MPKIWIFIVNSFLLIGIFSARLFYSLPIQLFGFYQGDIWYFFTYYGKQMQTLPFYSIEYPLGYVLIQKGITTLSQILFGQVTYTTFLILHALIMIPLTLVVIWLILEISQILNISYKKIWPFLFFAPSLITYSSINYDIFPIFCALSSIYLLLKKHSSLAYFLLALGVIIKLYPAIFLPIYIVWSYQKEGVTKTLKYLGIFGATIVGINLPYYLYYPDQWIFPFHYQMFNPEQHDPTTISYYLGQIGLEKFRPLIFIITVGASTLAATIKSVKTELSEKKFLFWNFFIIYSLVIWNQLFIPQYILWFWPYLIINLPIIYMLWIPLDLINALTRLTYFKLKDNPQLFNQIHLFILIYFILIYGILIKRAIKDDA